MAILFVAAEAEELKPFAEHLTAVRKLSWPLDYAQEGILEGRRLMLVANGAGPSLASRAVETAIRAIAAADLSASKLEAVISVGFCGALQADLTEGAIVLPAQVTDSASKENFACKDLGIGRELVGTLVSQDRIAGTTGEKQQLGQQGFLAVDMEASGVAMRAKRAQLPFSCIKIVSDRLDESFSFDFNALRSKSGRLARGKITYYAITHPWLVPELYRLKRRTEVVARTLGEFLVSCRFHLEGEPALSE